MTSSAQAAALLVCGTAAIGVFVVMLWSVVAWHRSGPPVDAYSQSTWVEIVWTLVPIAIIVCLMLPAIVSITRR